MTRVFISDLNSHVSRALVSAYKEGEDNENVVVGSVPQGSKLHSSKGISECVNEKDRSKVLSLVASCDHIIYTIDNNLIEASEALRILKRGGYEGVKTFLLISTVLTWGESTIPLIEEAHLNRKTGNNKYIAIKTFENQVMQSNREQLVTRVIGSGILYGHGEPYFADIFMNAWLCGSNLLPKYSPHHNCLNVLPTIYVGDLANMVYAVAQSPPESSYILGVDKSKNTLKDISFAISSYLSKKEVREPSQEEIDVLRGNKTDSFMDAISCNLIFDTETSSASSLGMTWKFENGLIENVASVANEYIAYNNLSPIRVVLMGPPGSGKSFWARKLSDSYFVPHLKVSDMLNEAMQSGDVELLSEIEKSKSENEGRVGAKVLSNIVRKSLNLPERRNKGWILDGLPRTYEEAKFIFSDRGEEGKDLPSDDAAESDLVIDKLLLPTTVVVFDASEENLKQTLMDGSEGEHNNEKDFIRRLKKYNDNNNKVDCPQSYFEAVAKCDTLLLPGGIVGTDEKSIFLSLQTCINRGNKPKNFHPTMEEIYLQGKQKEENERLAREESERVRLANENAELEKEKERRSGMEKRMNEIQKQLKMVEDSKQVQLRSFLMETIVPSLADSLTSICKIKPEDPIDYISEFLFDELRRS